MYAGHPERVRKYVLEYHPLDANQGRTVSCLKSVQEFGEKDDASFPPISLKYTETLPGVSMGSWSGAYDVSQQYNGTDLPPATAQYRYFLPWSLGTVNRNYDSGLKFADYNRDGLVDFVFNHLTDQFKLSIGI